MVPDTRFKIIDHKVAHEIIDGEAVVIHFDSGNYYSMNGVSSQVWQWLAAGASRRQILGAFRELTPEQVQSIDGFAESLVTEEVLQRLPEPTAAESLPEVPAHTLTFEEPKFVKYNDMQNLLLSDPIHDVDEMGWPNLAPDNEKM
jgi:hypothetical protein